MDSEIGLSGKTVLVVGTGISGIAAVNLLATQSANIILLDGNTELSPETVAAKFSEDIHYDLILGDLPDQVMDRIDLAVLSPGVPTDLPFVVRMQEAGIPIWGEIELAYVCGKGKVVAITGTNGKTTTTALTGEIMKAYYDSVFVVGNIGLPYTQYAMQMCDDTVTVAEVSSFQLETIHKFCPQVSAILNITPDHLNRHHTMECYTETKARVAMNQTKEQMCVLNYEDERLQQVAKNMSTDVFWFSSARELERGIFLRGEEIVCRDGEEITLCNIHDLKLLGMHNYENVMAAAAIAHGMNVPWDVIRKVVCEFQAVPHRIEFVKEVNGVKYYNDSIGTSPASTIAGLNAFDENIILLAGGSDKGLDYTEIGETIAKKVRVLLLTGPTAEKIENATKLAMNKAGKETVEIIHCKDLQEAVSTANEKAKSGEIVLMSPASASFDAFKNFIERGIKFKEFVNNL